MCEENYENSVKWQRPFKVKGSVTDDLFIKKIIDHNNTKQKNTAMSTISDDWYEESSPNLAATLDPNEKKDHDNQNESNILDEPDVMMANCSLPTPFFR